MITVKVTYTVKQEYVEANKEKIARFLEDFKSLDGNQFLYSVFQKEDEATFVHLSQYTTKQAQEAVLKMPSFIDFQESRDKKMASEHQLEVLNFIGSAGNIFKDVPGTEKAQ